jgi:DNA-binding NarL/FixJ family response regulator
LREGRGVFGKKETRAFRSINDIEARVRVALAQRGKLALRSSVPIMVIDDQPFEPAVNLSNNHYVINYREDLTRIEDAKSYPIVLCDLQGVGAQLHSELQGAHLIRELKTHYPEKVVIAYSGIARNAGMARAAQDHADKFLRKDADIDSWIEALDAAILQVSDPVYMWKEFRKRVLDSGMTPFQLAELEDAFVNNLFEGDAKVQTSIGDRVSRLGLQGDLRSIVTGFVSSLIFKALVG